MQWSFYESDQSQVSRVTSDLRVMFIVLAFGSLAASQRFTQAALQTEKEMKEKAYYKNIKKTRLCLLRLGNRFQEQCVCSSVIILKVVAFYSAPKLIKRL